MNPTTGTANTTVQVIRPGSAISRSRQSSAQSVSTRASSIESVPLSKFSRAFVYCLAGANVCTIFVIKISYPAKLCDWSGKLTKPQGGELRASSGTSNLAEAERYLVMRLEGNGALEAFKAARKLEDIRTKSINNALQVVRRILNLAARSWRDEHGLTWIETAPLITILPVRDTRKPYPLDWDEQRKFYQRLPGHLARMALYKVNTGTREQEVCQLRWDWEVKVPELETSVFIVPGNIVKNREDRLIVHNDIAQSVIEAVRGKHYTFVFTYHGRPIKKMNNTAWKHAWKAVGLPVSDAYLRGPHNLKHTLGRRLRAAGVPLETRRVGRNAAG